MFESPLLEKEGNAIINILESYSGFQPISRSSFSFGSSRSRWDPVQ